VRTPRYAAAPCKWWLANLHVPKIWLIFGDGVKRPGDHWPLPLTWNWCGMSQPSCQFWCFCDFSLSSYGQTRAKLTTLVALLTLTFDLWGHCACSWCGSSYSIRIPSLKFVGLPFPKIWLIFGHGVKRPCDLDLWPLISKWSHGSLCHGFHSCQIWVCYTLPFST